MKRDKEVKPTLVCDHQLRTTKIVGKDGKLVRECVKCNSFVED